MDNVEIATLFADTDVSIYGNSLLRLPQIEGYAAIKEHFESSDGAGYVQLPVGCGKTGLMGLTPFGIARGRVLIITPNVTIRANVIRELNVSDPNCFYVQRGVFTPVSGPFVSELKPGANIHDCDSAHIVVANIQQFAGANNRWYERLPKDYFDMLLVDEGHHGVADTWQRLFDYFSDAKVMSFTATPMRSDGRTVMGNRVYAFGYGRSMVMGFISPIEAVYVKPEEITFTAEGQTKTLSIDEILQMREHDWFSRGIAMSEQCNRSIVQASYRQLSEVRKHGTPRQIIAVACSIRHATQIAALYQELGLKVAVLHSNLDNEEKDEIEAGLRSGVLDVVVQVAMLGEGYDLKTLSVAAVFRPYRSLTPYIQFVGRILRLAVPDVPHSPANQVYLVSHVGLNDERWWTDFTKFDRDDQQFFAEYLGGEDREVESSASSPRLTLRPFMRVLNETVAKYVKRGFLNGVDATMVRELVEVIRSKGFDPTEFGLTEEMIRMRLEIAARASQEVAAFAPLVQPQRKREALRGRLAQEARSIADTVINRLELKHNEANLKRFFVGRGDNNSAILITLAQGRQNKIMGVESGGRDDASLEQFQKAVDASADIVDSLTAFVAEKVGAKNATN